MASCVVSALYFGENCALVCALMCSLFMRGLCLSRCRFSARLPLATQVVRREHPAIGGTIHAE